MPRRRRERKRNSSTECVTDSKPTNAHGASATMLSTWSGTASSFSVENAGASEAVRSPHSATASASAMPPQRSAASATCKRTARRLAPISSAPTTSSASAESPTSPRYTSYPATV